MTTLKESEDKLLDQLIAGCESTSDLFGADGLFVRLKKRLIEQAMSAEMDNHLGYKKHAKAGRNSGNSRNGFSSKEVTSNNESLDIEVPRDRNGSFEPQIIPKNSRKFDGFNEQVLALYARGMSTRDISSMLKELYHVEVSASLISDVTDAVIDDAKAWQSRPLEMVYPIVYFDALRVKIKEDKRIINKAVYLALGVGMEGNKELLGIWISQNEGAKFWLEVCNELSNRGLNDIFVACIDGLNGFPEAIESVFPKTEIQLCIVHMIRNSTKYVSHKDRKALCADLKKIYGADTIDEAELALEALSERWDSKYPTVSQCWLRHWEHINPFFAYPKEIRKVIYTTNAIESLNRSVRKVFKTKGVFPSDDSVRKIMYLALDNISKSWTMPVRDWSLALNQFAIRFEERFPK